MGPEPGVEDYDSSEPYEATTHSINLPLGVAVLHLAFPYIPRDASQQDHNALPTLLTKKLVAVAICSDSSVRLVVLPLAPPSEKMKRSAEEADRLIVVKERTGAYEETLLVTLGGNVDQRIPTCAALTLAPAAAEACSDLDMNELDIQVAKRTLTDRRCILSRRESRSRSRSLGKRGGCDIVVASGSADASGPMLIHRIPLSADGRSLDLTSSNRSEPWSIQHSPLPIASLNFNPSLPGDALNGRLLVMETEGTVRVLDYTSAIYSKQCSSLVSLYPNSWASTSREARKYLLDARWVLGGTAILALADDGGWGIWDLEGHGPKPQSGSLASSIPTMGSSFTFAISGRVNGGSNNPQANSTRLETTEEPKTVKLAPTTPSTRRVRQENLFSGPPRQPKALAGGGISVLAIDDTTTVDEAILLWHNDAINIIPSLRKHWANKAKGSGNLFGNEAKGELRIVGNFGLEGQRRTGVSLLRTNGKSIGERFLDYAVLITGETRLIILSSRSDSPPRTIADLGSPRSYQRLLEEGDLDLNSVHKILSTIGDNAPRR
ncbi:MAG: hypothetical protein LQ346_003045 [Caloplaca aetnensis]|nr:MAG: hypothetical protein LQ346_003045 [Caloplaca aetnensis]